MKTILVPTDFSEEAGNALNFAILLAQKTKARLVLFNAFDIPVPVAEMSYSILKKEIEDAKTEAVRNLRTECEKIRHASGVEYDYCAEEGEAISSILTYTKSHDFDYIIMGTKGAGKNKTGIFGSTTSRLMAKTDIPIIAIPEKSHFGKEIRRITFATNYAITDAAAITKLRDLAAALNAEVNVLHISESALSGVEEAKLMEKFIKKLNAESAQGNLSFQVISGENPGKRLEEYVSEGSTDMIVMSTHLRNTLERLFTGSLTKRIALKTPIPLIVFHHHKEASLKLTP